MLNIEFYEIKRIVDNIIFIILFFIMAREIGYSYTMKNKFLNLINIFLVILLIKNRFNLYFLRIDFLILRTDFLISFIELLLVCKISYSLSLKKAFLFSILYALIYIGVSISIDYTIEFVCIFKKLNFIGSTLFDVLQFIIRSLLMILIACFSHKLKNLSINKKYYLYIGLTIIINMIIILFLEIASNTIYDCYSIITDNKLNFNQSDEIMTFVNFADFVLPYIVVVSNIVFVLLLIKLLKSIEEKSKLELINKKHDMEYNYYLNIKESQEKVRRIYHDINNHMTNIKIIQNKNEQVDIYLDSIHKEISDFKNVFNTGNVILDIILSEKSRLCKSKNIYFLCNIYFSKCDFIDMIDVSSVFSNLLDNAIEACEKIEDDADEKYISIKGTIVKSYYIIKCENSKINKVIIKNNKIISGKKDKYFHGIGIESIKSSLKKYDGELEIENEENKFISTIYIPLKQ